MARYLVLSDKSMVNVENIDCIEIENRVDSYQIRARFSSVSTGRIIKSDLSSRDEAHIWINSALGTIIID